MKVVGEISSKIIAISLAAFLLITLNSTPVLAQSIPGSNGSGFVSTPAHIEIYPFNNTSGYDINLTNPNSSIYNEYSSIWAQFVPKGVVVSSVEVPSLFNISTTKPVSFISEIQFTPKQILSGGSDEWWLMPFSGLNLKNNTNERLSVTIYSTLDGLANVTSFNDGVPSFGTAQFNEIYYYNGTYNNWNNNNSIQTESINVGNLRYQLTFINTFTPIFPGEFYFIETTITNEPIGVSALMSQSNVGNQSIVSSWIDSNNTLDYMHASTGLSVLFTNGLSNGISGIQPEFNSQGFGVQNKTNIVIGSSNQWFNEIFPYIANSSISGSNIVVKPDLLFNVSGLTGDNAEVLLTSQTGAYGYKNFTFALWVSVSVAGNYVLLEQNNVFWLNLSSSGSVSFVILTSTGKLSQGLSGFNFGFNNMNYIQVDRLMFNFGTGNDNMLDVQVNNLQGDTEYSNAFVASNIASSDITFDPASSYNILFGSAYFNNFSAILNSSNDGSILYQNTYNAQYWGSLGGGFVSNVYSTPNAGFYYEFNQQVFSGTTIPNFYSTASANIIGGASSSTSATTFYFTGQFIPATSNSSVTVNNSMNIYLSSFQLDPYVKNTQMTSYGVEITASPSILSNLIFYITATNNRFSQAYMYSSNNAIIYFTEGFALFGEFSVSSSYYAFSQPPPAEQTFPTFQPLYHFKPAKHTGSWHITIGDVLNTIEFIAEGPVFYLLATYTGANAALNNFITSQVLPALVNGVTLAFKFYLNNIVLPPFLILSQAIMMFVNFITHVIIPVFDFLVYWMGVLTNIFIVGVVYFIAVFAAYGIMRGFYEAVKYRDPVYFRSRIEKTWTPVYSVITIVLLIISVIIQVTLGILGKLIP